MGPKPYQRKAARDFPILEESFEKNCQPDCYYFLHYCGDRQCYWCVHFEKFDGCFKYSEWKSICWYNQHSANSDLQYGNIICIVFLNTSIDLQQYCCLAQ